MTRFANAPGGKIIVLGATSAIAQATIDRLARSGASIALVGRDIEKLSEIKTDLEVRHECELSTFATDLAHCEHKPDFFNRMCEEMGGCDAVLVFYGTLGDQTEADHDPDVVREILNVNFVSAAEWMTLAGNALEKSQVARPVLIGISSVAGDRGRRSNFAYGSAKSGMSTFLQGMAHRAAKSKKLKVINFKLGFVKSPMTQHLNPSGPLWAEPDQIAAKIERSFRKGGPVIYAPFFWRWIMLTIRLTPALIFNKVNL